MCGRFSLTASAELLRSFFYLLEGTPLFEPRYNIAPSQDVAAIRCDTNQRRTARAAALGHDSLIGARTPRPARK